MKKILLTCIAVACSLVAVAEELLLWWMLRQKSTFPRRALTTYMPVLTTGLHLGPMPRAPESSAWL